MTEHHPYRALNADDVLHGLRLVSDATGGSCKKSPPGACLGTESEVPRPQRGTDPFFFTHPEKFFQSARDKALAENYIQPLSTWDLVGMWGTLLLGAGLWALAIWWAV